MSLGGIDGTKVLPGLIREPGHPAAGGASRQVTERERASAGSAAGAVAGSGATSPSASAVPAAAPPGTDPALWSVLTTEERAYFARVQAMGPLTYRPGAGDASSAPAVRGGRIDIRV
ncbi:MAG TPA: hypothetical protein VKZ58_02020 [Longimicrobiales bacterium]|nr:hypothetical protein [Longimicrobiales bacterium]